MNKKTGIVTLDFLPARGGIATYWSQLYKNLPTHQYHIIAPPAESEHDSVGVIRVPFLFAVLWPRWLRLFFSVWQLQKKEQYTSLVAGQVIPVGTVLLLLQWFGRIPQYTVSCHGMDIAIPRGRKRFLTRLVLQRADRIVANSMFTKQLLQSEYTIASEKICIVYPAPQIRGTQAQKKDNTTSCNLLSVGRLVARKGIDMVLQSLPIIWETFPDVTYTIVGDGPDKNRLQKIAATLPEKYQDKIQFVGNITDPEKKKMYERADVFVLPSRDIDGDVEGFGIVNIEAGSFGLPVITGIAGGVGETVVHQGTGLQVDGSDQASVTKALLTLIGDPDLRLKYGEAGKRFAERYSWQKSAEHLQACV